MFKRDDFMSVLEVAAEFKVGSEAVRRWIRKKYLDPAEVEVHGGQYYVRKEAVQLWKNALDGKQPIRGRRLPALEGFRGIYTEDLSDDSSPGELQDLWDKIDLDKK